MSVTILAFIFVPLSLATSIFGMNLQELNESGQPTWVFLATAGLILWIAFCIWGIFYQWMKYIHAPRWGAANWRLEQTKEAKDCEEEANISLYVRLKFLLWLLCHGHIIWCWRSGIIFSLLTKGRLGFTPTCAGARGEYCAHTDTILGESLRYLNLRPQDPLVSYSTHSAHAPCAYVFLHSKDGEQGAFSFARGG